MSLLSLHPHTRCHLLFLWVPHPQHEQIFVLKVVAHDGVVIDEHVSILLLSGDCIGWNETWNSECPKCKDRRGQWLTKVGLVNPEMGH